MRSVVSSICFCIGQESFSDNRHETFHGPKKCSEHCKCSTKKKGIFEICERIYTHFLGFLLLENEVDMSSDSIPFAIPGKPHKETLVLAGINFKSTIFMKVESSKISSKMNAEVIFTYTSSELQIKLPHALFSLGPLISLAELPSRVMISLTALFSSVTVTETTHFNRLCL